MNFSKPLLVYSSQSSGARIPASSAGSSLLNTATDTAVVRYYRRRIRNRTQAFEWHRFQWPWV